MAHFAEDTEEVFGHNNPNDEPTGSHTLRCQRCGSNDLWDDNVAYGCKNCGAWLGSN